MKKLMGLTGPTGAGKTEVSRLLSEYGCGVVDCDFIAHQATEKGSPVLPKLISVFGDGIVNEQGKLDRKKLAEIAFSSAENTRLLNDTLLPYLTVLILQKAGTLNQNWVVLDAPTLFESGINRMCDVCVTVLSDREIRLNRIMQRDHITEQEALLRMNAQHPDDYYTSKSDFTLHNNGNLHELTLQVQNLITRFSIM